MPTYPFCQVKRSPFHTFSKDFFGFLQGRENEGVRCYLWAAAAVGGAGRRRHTTKKATPKKGKEESRLLGRAPGLERFTRFRKKKEGRKSGTFSATFWVKKGEQTFFVGAAMSDTFLLVNDSFVHFYPSFFWAFPSRDMAYWGWSCSNGFEEFSPRFMTARGPFRITPALTLQKKKKSHACPWNPFWLFVGTSP